ncbi:MAG: hypothetical protein JW934_20395 [Anaerolineae bacterium]|nr:hypothetical protein [Anaerolineae bacterium]
MDFKFELAAPQDDPALRRLLATNAMPGSIAVTFEREPDYFLGCSTMGRFWQVLIGRDVHNGDLGAVLCRATQPRWVNGEVREVGYLGQLRVDAPYRGRWVLQQGIDALHTLHQDGRATHYLSAIADENRVALGVLVEHPRPSFPTMRQVAHLHTLGIILGRPRPTQRSPYQIERGSAETLPEIVAFLHEWGARRQFFPAYAAADFDEAEYATLRDFRVDDFVVARQHGEIAGVTGLWDQKGYKQTVVQGYGGALRWLRPLYNLGAPLLGIQPLPGIGEQIKSAYASLICVQNDDPEVFRALLRRVYNLAAGRGYAHLMLGLDERDPLLPVAEAYPHIAYLSRLFLAHWPEALDLDLDDRLPYIEIAAL